MSMLCPKRGVALCALACALALCLGLLPVAAVAVPSDNGAATTNVLEAESVEPTEGITVWITGGEYSNIPYQYVNVRGESVLLPESTAIYYDDTNQYAFVAGTHYSESGEETVSLGDQSDLAAIDCWTATGMGSTYDPIVPLEFYSQLAKVSLVIDPGAWADASPVEVTALDVETGYRCGSKHLGSIEASGNTGNIDLAVTEMEDGKWKVEGLLVPGSAPELSIACGGMTKTVSLASAFGGGFSAGKAYSADLVLDGSGAAWDIQNAAEESRGTWSANFYDSKIILFYQDKLMPDTICGADVVMDDQDSFGLKPETALTGKVTVGSDVEEVQMKDLLFSSPQYGRMVYEEGTENTFVYNELDYVVLLQPSGSTEWSTQPIPLNAGETSTVLIHVDGEHEIYYSIEITRLEQTQIASQPQDAIVEEGETARFSVAATGENLTYQWQWSTNGSDWTTISENATSSTYTISSTTTDMSGYQYRCVVTGAGGVSVISQAAALTVIAKPVTGVSLDKTELSLYVGGSATLTATVEPSDATNQNVTWQSDNAGVATVEGGTVTAVGAGETTIRVTAEDGGHTATCKVTVRSRPSYNPPTASDQAVGKIEAADDGATVEVTLPSGQTRLDAEVFEVLAGRDVTLVVAVPGGVTWTIYGQDVPEGAELPDIDLGASLGGDGIPADVVNAVTGEVGTVQLSLAHDGAFGFEMTLTAPLGEGCAGLWANLYHYDADAGRLVFQAAARVGEDGGASFALSHASEWAIVVDSASHELPFADVSPSDWFANAVGGAYRTGLMTGYADGSGLFGPGDGLTRAQAATVLWRALGQGAQAPACGMADVDQGAWYAGAVDWAASSGLMTGYADGSGLFGSDDALSREQLATVLWRAAGEPDAGAFDPSAFSDGGEASEWAEPALAWAASTGVLEGSDDGEGGTELRPTEAVTRAEMAAMVVRWLTTE